MKEEQAFLLCMLRIVKTEKNDLRANPSLRNEEAHFVPSRLNIIPVTKCQIGTPIYNPTTKPRFKGLVLDIDYDQQSGKIILQYVGGYTEILDQDCYVYSCCSND